MPNPYITDVGSYMQQDQQGLSPVFQNIGAQQQYMNQQLAQNGQMAQPVSQGSGYSGLSPMALASMLRKKDPTKPAFVTDYSQPMPELQQYANPAYQQAGY